MLVALWGHCGASARVLTPCLSCRQSAECRHLPEKQDLDDVVQGVWLWLQDDELVHQDRGLVGPQVWVVQQVGGLLGGTEAVGSQQDVLQLCVRVGNGGWFVVIKEVIKEVLRREIQGLKVYPVDGSPVFSMTRTYF